MKPILNKEIQSQLVESFLELRDPVGILLFTKDDLNCEYCQLTEQLLDEVTVLSDELVLEKINMDMQPEMAKQYAVENGPVIVIADKNEDSIIDHGIRFVGIPGGHEFSSLIHSLIMVSRRDSGLSADTREYLRSLDEDVFLQVFVTPSCPYCPQAVILAHQMAYESSNIQAEMVEATEFPDLSDLYDVSGVPHTIINQGLGSIVGAAPEGVLLQKIKESLQPQIGG